MKSLCHKRQTDDGGAVTDWRRLREHNNSMILNWFPEYRKGVNGKAGKTWMNCMAWWILSPSANFLVVTNRAIFKLVHIRENWMNVLEELGTFSPQLVYKSKITSKQKVKKSLRGLSGKIPLKITASYESQCPWDKRRISAGLPPAAPSLRACAIKPSASSRGE